MIRLANVGTKLSFDSVARRDSGKSRAVSASCRSFDLPARKPIDLPVRRSFDLSARKLPPIPSSKMSKTPSFLGDGVEETMDKIRKHNDVIFGAVSLIWGRSPHGMKVRSRDMSGNGKYA